MYILSLAIYYVHSSWWSHRKTTPRWNALSCLHLYIQKCDRLLLRKSWRDIMNMCIGNWYFDLLSGYLIHHGWFNNNVSRHRHHKFLILIQRTLKCYKIVLKFNIKTIKNDLDHSVIISLCSLENNTERCISIGYK